MRKIAEFPQIFHLAQVKGRAGVAHVILYTLRSYILNECIVCVKSLKKYKIDCFSRAPGTKRLF